MISNINFNIIDKAIYFIETAASKFAVFIHNEKTPDPEDIILAATEHLQAENEELKDFRIPEKITYDEESRTYICPKCRKSHVPELIEVYKIKYCAECGKRFFQPDKRRS